MKSVLIVIFSLLVVGSYAQVADDFSDGDFSNNPAWSGDAGSFIVNSDNQLQLNASSAGHSYLSVPAPLTSGGSVEWDFYLQLAFAPSSSNYCRVYLSSDRSNISDTLNGYFLQFGESLSNDAIELFRQDGVAVTSVCRATNGAIASPFEARVRIVRDSAFNWKLYVDYSGGSTYQIECTSFDSAYTQVQFAGIVCTFTSGNVDNFYLDDFYFGEEILDTVPPIIYSIVTLNDSVVQIDFSEAVDQSALVCSNYSVDQGIGIPISIAADSSGSSRYRLNFSNRFISGQDYHLTVSSVTDLSQNVIDIFPITFRFIAIANANKCDVIITEVYFAPKQSSPLPYAEYVEIFNRNDSAVDMRNWTISDAGTDGNIMPYILGANEYAILFDRDDGTLFSIYPNAVAVDGLPSLNNDGDQIYLRDANGILIDELKFDTKTYRDSYKDDGGWSVERIDPGFICVNTGNWLASASSFHGTPGSVNSVNGIFTDDKSPYIKNAYLTDSVTLKIIFSEPVSADASAPLNFKVTRSDGNELPVQSVVYSQDSVLLVFQNPLPREIFTAQVSENVHDCPGNSFQTFQTVKFGYSSLPVADDIVINEVMFYCLDGSNDFVEIYNNSDKIFDLKDWVIQESESGDVSMIREDAVIAADHKLFFPGEYLVLSEDATKVCTFYSCKDPFAFLDVSSMPEFSSDNGCVVINDNFGNRISSMQYSDDMHFPILTETRGVSLERLTFTNEENNWHSAAATAGYATPGYTNSSSFGLASGGDGVFVSGEIFSPDGDGYADVLAIHYRSEQAGSVLSLNAFDVNGIPVRTIMDHKTVGAECEIYWDGLSDKFEELPQGVYVILAEAYDLEGNRSEFKKGVFLTRNSMTAK